MSRFWILLFAGFSGIPAVRGQGYDHTWVIGMHELPGVPGFNNALIQFTPDSIKVTETDLGMNFESTVGVMSDSSGQLLFYTNGCRIAGANGQTMPAGDGLNPGEMHDWVCAKTGYVCPRGAMALPKPGHPNKYLLFHMGARYDPVRKLTYGPFYYTAIDMALNGGNGVVTEKNLLLTDGDLEPFTAVRHGNGRDWWLVVPVYATAGYRIFLLNPHGISGPFVQHIGPEMNCRRIGTSVFSRNGQKFAHAQNCQVLVMDFDRCAGVFSNPQLLDLPDHVVGGGGVAFSPDNQRLLVSTQLQILEADLTQTTPVLDSAFTWNYQWGVSLQHMQYTPFDQILLNHMHRANYMSLIAKPGESGKAMDFAPNGIPLPVYSVRSLPNFPNYRLYDLPGSPCDTLGISVGVPAAPVATSPLQLFPNPATAETRITFEPLSGANIEVWLLDIAGHVIETTAIPDGATELTLSLDKCRSGMYWVQLRRAGQVVAAQKMAVIR